MKGMISVLLILAIIHTHGAPMDKSEWLSTIEKLQKERNLTIEESPHALQNLNNIKNSPYNDYLQWLLKNAKYRDDQSNNGNNQGKRPLNLLWSRNKQSEASDSDSDTDQSRRISVSGKTLRRKISTEKSSNEEDTAEKKSDESVVRKRDSHEKDSREKNSRGSSSGEKNVRRGKNDRRRDTSESLDSADDTDSSDRSSSSKSKNRDTRHREYGSRDRKRRRDSTEEETRKRSSLRSESSDESESDEEEFKQYLRTVLQKRQHQKEILQMLRNRKIEERDNLSRTEVYYNRLYRLNRDKFVEWKKKVELKSQLLSEKENLSKEELKRLCNISEETEEDLEEYRIKKCVKSHMSTNDRFDIVTRLSGNHASRFDGKHVDKVVRVEKDNDVKVVKVSVLVNETLADGEPTRVDVKKERQEGSADLSGTKMVNKVINKGGRTVTISTGDDNGSLIDTVRIVPASSTLDRATKTGLENEAGEQSPSSDNDNPSTVQNTAEEEIPNGTNEKNSSNDKGEAGGPGTKSPFQNNVILINEQEVQQDTSTKPGTVLAEGGTGISSNKDTANEESSTLNKVENSSNDSQKRADSSIGQTTAVALQTGGLPAADEQQETKAVNDSNDDSSSTVAIAVEANNVKDNGGKSDNDTDETTALVGDGTESIDRVEKQNQTEESILVPELVDAIVLTSESATVENSDKTDGNGESNSNVDGNETQASEQSVTSNSEDKGTVTEALNSKSNTVLDNNGRSTSSLGETTDANSGVAEPGSTSKPENDGSVTKALKSNTVLDNNGRSTSGPDVTKGANSGAIEPGSTSNPEGDGSVTEASKSNTVLDNSGKSTSGPPESKDANLGVVEPGSTSNPEDDGSVTEASKSNTVLDNNRKSTSSLGETTDVNLGVAESGSTSKSEDDGSVTDASKSNTVLDNNGRSISGPAEPKDANLGVVEPGSMSNPEDDGSVTDASKSNSVLDNNGRSTSGPAESKDVNSKVAKTESAGTTEEQAPKAPSSKSDAVLESDNVNLTENGSIPTGSSKALEDVGKSSTVASEVQQTDVQTSQSEGSEVTEGLIIEEIALADSGVNVANSVKVTLESNDVTDNKTDSTIKESTLINELESTSAPQRDDTSVTKQSNLEATPADGETAINNDNEKTVSSTSEPVTLKTEEATSSTSQTEDSNTEKANEQTDSSTSESVTLKTEETKSSTSQTEDSNTEKANKVLALKPALASSAYVSSDVNTAVDANSVRQNSVSEEGDSNVKNNTNPEDEQIAAPVVGATEIQGETESSSSRQKTTLADDGSVNQSDNVAITVETNSLLENNQESSGTVKNQTESSATESTNPDEETASDSETKDSRVTEAVQGTDAAASKPELAIDRDNVNILVNENNATENNDATTNTAIRQTDLTIGQSLTSENVPATSTSEVQSSDVTESPTELSSTSSKLEIPLANDDVDVSSNTRVVDEGNNESTNGSTDSIGSGPDESTTLKDPRVTSSVQNEDSNVAEAEEPINEVPSPLPATALNESNANGSNKESITIKVDIALNNNENSTDNGAVLQDESIIESTTLPNAETESTTKTKSSSVADVKQAIEELNSEPETTVLDNNVNVSNNPTGVVRSNSTLDESSASSNNGVTERTESNNNTNDSITLGNEQTVTPASKIEASSVTEEEAAIEDSTNRPELTSSAVSVNVSNKITSTIEANNTVENSDKTTISIPEQTVLGVKESATSTNEDAKLLESQTEDSNVEKTEQGTESSSVKSESVVIDENVNLSNDVRNTSETNNSLNVTETLSDSTGEPVDLNDDRSTVIDDVQTERSSSLWAKIGFSSSPVSITSSSTSANDIQLNLTAQNENLATVVKEETGTSDPPYNTVVSEAASSDGTIETFTSESPIELIQVLL